MKFFIGWDSREEIAYEVAKRSLLDKTSIDIEVIPIKQGELRNKNLYWRDHDPLSSTEFSFTRFLTPYLAGYKGWAVFCDCDFLFRHDVAGLEDYMDGERAVYVVKHQYNPPEKTKMDGAVQTQYPRKNWSSFMLMNCAHPAMQILTPELVSRETGLYLHRFQWLENKYIGELPLAYNYLEGWHNKEDCPNPIAVHFTRGGPWFRDYMHVEYGDEWIDVARRVEHDRI